MRSTTQSFSALCVFALVLRSVQALAFPEHRSLAGLDNEEVEKLIQNFKRVPAALPVPQPINDTSSKLVNDAAHPWKALKPGDIRGPCPGLNTLASHGYIERSGITTPSKIVKAAQEGFNMGFDLAAFVTYAAFLVDGNLVTDLVSIGEKSSKTGPDAPPPAIIGGLNTHGVFEGDASTTRGDKFFGDNFSFNETLFDQILETANQIGTDDGSINFATMAQVRWNRIQDSIARNPTFDFTSPRYVTAYAESVFPLAYFANGTTAIDISGVVVTPQEMRSFFQQHRYPEGFFRRRGAFGLNEVGQGIFGILSVHPILPGRNANSTVNSYTVDPADTGITEGTCYIYKKHVGTIQSLYPYPTGKLLANLKQNLNFFYQTGVSSPNCPQVFPYGQ